MKREGKSVSTITLTEAVESSNDGWGFEQGDEIEDGLSAFRLLGGGKRYEAYLAHDPALLNLVVAKILRPSRVADERALESLESEYRALRRLNHPVIPRVYSLGGSRERPYITLEFVEGPRLSTLIRKHGPLPMEQLMPLAVQICSALHYMHGCGWVHLDVKPKNIIMGTPPRLIDLSIARTFEEAAQLSINIGTDGYMAPEQIVPFPGAVGPAADVFGLGATLYEAATGVKPFPLGSEDSGFASESSALVHRVTRPVGELISACLEREASSRPTPSELADLLAPLVEATPRKIVLGSLRPRWK